MQSSQRSIPTFMTTYHYINYFYKTKMITSVRMHAFLWKIIIIYTWLGTHSGGQTVWLWTLLNARQQVWVSRVIGEIIIHVNGYRCGTLRNSQWPWVPSIGNHLQPYTGYVDVSIWVKKSRVEQKKPHKKHYWEYMEPVKFWFCYHTIRNSSVFCMHLYRSLEGVDVTITFKNVQILCQQITIFSLVLYNLVICSNN